MDIFKRLESQGKKIETQRQTGAPTVPEFDTAYKCLNRARKRTDLLLNANVGLTSFQSALDSGAGVEYFTVWEEGDTEVQRAIVKNLKDDWQQDTKYVSAMKGTGFELGNTVTWTRLNMRWLIVWQDFIYEEYFRGEMYRANYQIKWIDDKGKIQTQWASIRGPVETKAKVDNVAGDYMGGRQNDSLELWTSNNHGAAESLRRYELLKIGRRTWRIHVVDDISNPNVLRISLIENFNNVDTDDVIQGIPDGQIIMPEETVPSVESYTIVGVSTVKEGMKATYKVYDKDGVLVAGDWTVQDSKGTIQTFTGVSEISIRGGKIGDKFTISFEDKAQVVVPTVSLFS